MYSLGISKSTNSNDYDDDRIDVNSVNEALKLFDNDGINFSDYKARFPKTDLIKNKKYSKLSVKQKGQLNLIFTSTVYEADLNCKNCGFKKQISESIKLYEFNVNDKINTIRTLEDNKLLSMDPTLPRTRDYSCKNVNCITHKNSKEKEAVFLRIPKSYNLSYICTKCYFSWNTV
tara:strand:+ start:319 stop:843 length:525 start_codon:yes stop_codon:yes gene_type:complete